VKFGKLGPFIATQKISSITKRSALQEVSQKKFYILMPILRFGCIINRQLINDALGLTTIAALWGGIRKASFDYLTIMLKLGGALSIKG
jgi:hypothetical protein